MAGRHSRSGSRRPTGICRLLAENPELQMRLESPTKAIPRLAELHGRDGSGLGGNMSEALSRPGSGRREESTPEPGAGSSRKQLLWRHILAAGLRLSAIYDYHAASGNPLRYPPDLVQVRIR